MFHFFKFVIFIGQPNSSGTLPPFRLLKTVQAKLFTLIVCKWDYFAKLFTYGSGIFKVWCWCTVPCIVTVTLIQRIVLFVLLLSDVRFAIWFVY